MRQINLGAALGVAVREFPLPTGAADYLLFVDRVAVGVIEAGTEKLWIDDLRTHQHFTLKTNPLRFEDLQDFIKCHHPANRFERRATERFKAFTYDELLQRDNVSLDIFWLKDKSLEDSENLPDSEMLAREIAGNIAAAMEQFSTIQQELKKNQPERTSQDDERH